METRKPKGFYKKVEDFVCSICSAEVKGTGFTDHCYNCLWSKHVDINPGDRASLCKGMMRPVRTEHDRKGFMILYECQKCKSKKRVKAAEDDDKELLFKLLDN